MIVGHIIDALEDSLETKPKWYRMRDICDVIKRRCSGLLGSVASYEDGFRDRYVPRETQKEAILGKIDRLRSLIDELEKEANTL